MLVVLRKRICPNAQQQLNDLLELVSGGQVKGCLPELVLLVDRHSVLDQCLGGGVEVVFVAHLVRVIGVEDRAVERGIAVGVAEVDLGVELVDEGEDRFDVTVLGRQVDRGLLALVGETGQLDVDVAGVT